MTDLTAMATLRTETRDEHVATERTALAVAMADGTITPAEYKTQLVAYRELHASLEGALESCPRACVRSVWGTERRKLALLDGDLEALAHVHTSESREVASVVAAECADIATMDGADLLGVLYVFEGSTLGATVLLPRLAENAGLPSGALRYYEGYGRDTARQWHAFGDRMNVALASADRRTRAVTSARSTFRRLRALFDAIR